MAIIRTAHLYNRDNSRDSVILYRSRRSGIVIVRSSRSAENIATKETKPVMQKNKIMIHKPILSLEL